MCLIICNPSNKRSPENYFRVAAGINSDGIGMAYNLNNSLVIKKDFASLDHAWAYYQNIPTESSVLVHFRLASVGSKTIENIHPFIIDNEECPKLIYCHNGTMPDYTFKESEKSDSVLFGEMTLKPFYAIDKLFYKKLFIQRLLKDHIKSSRVVFFNESGEFIILNELLGEKEDESWYSNTVFKNKTRNEEKKSKYKFARPIVYNPAQYTLPGSNRSNDAKKKYYLCGDPYYNVLSESEIETLKQKHRLNTRKLKQRGVIAKLSTVSDAKLYEAFLKKSEKMSDCITELPNSSTSKQLNFPSWKEKWGKLSEEQQRYIVAFNLQDKLLDVGFIIPPANNKQNKNQMLLLAAPKPTLTPEEEKQLDEIGRIIQEEE